MKCVTYTNESHIELCENMLKSFRRVNEETPFVVYCLDEKSHDYFTEKAIKRRSNVLFHQKMAITIGVQKNFAS